MTGLHSTDVRCEALFASPLQRTDAVTASAVAEAISQTVGQLGPCGCASKMAQEFGDHPETASDRMRWARHVISDLDLVAELELLADLGPAAEPEHASEPHGLVSVSTGA
jgi:hypothetical protein